MNTAQNGAQTESPDHAEVAFHPPLLLALALVIGFIFRWFAPLSFLPREVSVVLGPVVTVVSFGVFFWAVYTMRIGGASIPTGEPTDTIVVRGPYRFSRNPIYLSMLLLQIGVGLWANSLWFLILAAISATLLSWGVISREERYLEHKFGTEYSSYMSRVRRWI
ncbi:MAG: methyltransferase family protein [Acidiferrobacterales bacterium]